MCAPTDARGRCVRQRSSFSSSAMVHNLRTDALIAYPSAAINILACLVGRVYDTTNRLFDGSNARHDFDQRVERAHRQWFFTIGRLSSSAVVEIGMRSANGRFARIARPKRVDLPRKHPESVPHLWQASCTCPVMLGTIVNYLHGARIPFRLASYPSEESLPLAAHRLPPGGLLVDARLFLVSGGALLIAFPASEVVDLAAISSRLGGVVVPGTNDALPSEFRHVVGPIPPLGQLFGLPLVLDQRIPQSEVVVFRAFAASDYFEIPYDDYARLEQPRLASFSSAGELSAGVGPDQNSSMPVR